MEDKLLPCPFCGGDAKLETIGNDRTKSRATVIKCGGCYVTRKTAALRHSLEWTREAAIALWNTRAEKLCDDCPPVDYPTDKMRCLPCPRRSHGIVAGLEEYERTMREETIPKIIAHQREQERLARYALLSCPFCAARPCNGGCVRSGRGEQI